MVNGFNSKCDMIRWLTYFPCYRCYIIIVFFIFRKYRLIFFNCIIVLIFVIMYITIIYIVFQRPSRIQIIHYLISLILRFLVPPVKLQQGSHTRSVFLLFFFLYLKKILKIFQHNFVLNCPVLFFYQIVESLII